MIVAIAEASLASVISVNRASDTGTDDRSHGEFHDKPHVKVKQLTRLKWLWSPILTLCAQIYIFADFQRRNFTILRIRLQQSACGVVV